MVLQKNLQEVITHEYDSECVEQNNDLIIQIVVGIGYFYWWLIVKTECWHYS